MRIRVTDIDSWAWYLKLENMTAEELAKRLRREEPPNDKMLMGTAFHDILENPKTDEIDEIEHGGYKFIINCDCSIRLPQIREIRASKTYRVNGVEVDLSGKVDGIDIPVVTDHKLTFNCNLENYFASYQWRAYLDIFNADKFVYYVYSATQKGNTVFINDVSEVSMYRYPEMQSDLLYGVSGLLNFMKNNM